MKAIARRKDSIHLLEIEKPGGNSYEKYE